MRCAIALLFTLFAAQQVTAARLESGVVTLRRGEHRERLTLPCTPTTVLLRARLLIGYADGTLLELDVRGTITQLDVKRGSDPTPLSFEEAYRPDEDANEKARRLGSWLGITVASLLPFNVTDGGGLGTLVSLVVEWHAAAPFALRANLSPVSFGWIAELRIRFAIGSAATQTRVGAFLTPIIGVVSTGFRVLPMGGLSVTVRM